MLRRSGPALRLLQVHFTGTDWLARSAVPEGVAVCNATGMEVPIAEWVLGAMLRHVDRVAAEDKAMRMACTSGVLRPRPGLRAAGAADPPPPGRVELSSCTVGIVGYGLIGQQIATRAAAFGCRVLASSAAPRRCRPS